MGLIDMNKNSGEGNVKLALLQVQGFGITIVYPYNTYLGFGLADIVPSSLRGIMTAKLDRLTTSQQLVIKLAAVVGM